MAITTNGGAGITADAVATLSNKTLEAPTINNATFTGAQAGLAIKFNNTIVFEGTTDDAYELTVSAGDPTADRTITFPDATGTVVLGDTTDTLTNKTLTSPVVSGLTLSDASIVFEGATADAYETTLTVTDPTADRTITLPDATTTLVGTDTTQTLTNKTLTSPVLTTPSISNINAAGDLIVGTADNTIGIISIGTTGQVLTSDGTTASWATPAAGTTANDQAFAFAVQVFA